MKHNEIMKNFIPENWDIQPIIQIASLYQPQTISNDLFNNSYPYNVYGGGGLIGKFNQFNHEEPEIILSCRGNRHWTVNFLNFFS